MNLVISRLFRFYAQPLFAAIERRIATRWHEASVYTLNIPLNFTGAMLRVPLSKLVNRLVLITITTFLAMLLPFFNAVLGLLGALSFWPLTVYFPVSMHVAREGIGHRTLRRAMLQGLSIFCLLISMAAGVGSVADIVDGLRVTQTLEAAD